MNLDTQTRLAIMKRIDDYVEKERYNKEGMKDTDIMMPELNAISDEYGIEITDLFIAYMDHIAITNKRIAQEAEEEIDFSNVKKFY